MAKPKNSKTKWIWLSVLILLVCVAATTMIFVSRLHHFLIDDSGAIPLIPETDTDTTQTTVSPTVPTAPSSTQPPKNVGFETSDDNTMWTTDTQIELFRVSYVNGEQVITVNSDNGDKVIAPGAGNSYTFKLKNTGDVALDYTVTANISFTPADIEPPLTGRLNRYDGKWVVGGTNEYAQIPVLDTAVDTATLGAGKYTYYTLEWLWPFESRNDELDTMLGNLATEQDLIFTIAIKTTATESTNPYDDSGISSPQTGDNTNLTLWIVLAAGSCVMMILFLFYPNKEKRRDNAEAKTN